MGKLCSATYGLSSSLPSSFWEPRAVRRLVIGAETAGDPLLVVGAVLYISAGVIALTFEPAPVPKIATFFLTVVGGIAILNQFIRDFREKKLREHHQNGHE